MQRLVVFVVISWAMVGRVEGASVERMLMPGEVIQGHAKYEAECERCHSRFERTSQTALCRDCHEDVDADMRAKRGFHGRMRNAKNISCRVCHTDHKGRTADILSLDDETFDHQRTDFPLKGSHKRTACASCHEEKKKWREAPHKCIACHKDDDRHEGKLGKDCDKCHATKNWRESGFDHDKTDFRLKGAHEKILCAACHPGDRYKKTPKNCIACHRLDDVHNNRNGKKCADCHSTVEWKKPRFNHDKTDFPLKGKHRKVKCIACHPGDIYKDKAPTTCNGCHKENDSHRGKNGTKCESCHNTKGWSKIHFDHAKKTEFPLRGKHADVKCEACHKGNVEKEELEKKCYSCHRGDDIHQGAQGKECNSCHREKSWSERVRFDHDLSDFPLIGLHATAPCEACHLTATYKKTSKECAQCHRDDDEHKRRLGTRCVDCHTPNDWAVWKFDHDKQSDFRLTGKHKGLECALCHREPMGEKVNQSSACVACHQKDDAHLGRFGRQCDRCHNDESFEEVDLVDKLAVKKKDK